MAVSSRFGWVGLLPLSAVLDGYSAIAAPRYSTWRRRQLRDDLPEQFQAVLDRVLALADPALSGAVPSRVWDPSTLSWT